MDEPSFIDFDCPYCRTPIAYLSSLGGTVQDCPNCGNTPVVPRVQGEPGLVLPVPIETPRLLLRRLEPDDWKDVLEYCSDQSLFEFMSRHPLDEEGVTRWLAEDSKARLTAPESWWNLGIVVRDFGKVIGDVGINIRNTDTFDGMLSVSINRKFQRKGYGFEALAAMLVFCFRGIGLRRLTASCDQRNVPAIGLLRKLGLRQEGLFLQDQYVYDEYVDTMWFAMLRTEYLERAGTS